MRFFFLVLFIFTIPVTAHALKPEAILLVHFSSYGDKSGQRSVEKHLEAEFSRYYELKSKEEVEEAIKLLYDKIDSENASEEKIIKILVEGLDVDYALIFGLVVTGSVWKFWNH